MSTPHAPDETTAAYHEAGHALMAALLGGEVVRVTIESDDDGETGHTEVRWRDLTEPDRLERSAIVALAGPLAEHQFDPHGDVVERLASWHGDWREVQTALADRTTDADRDHLLRDWIQTIRRELSDTTTWERLCRLADQLEAHGTLEPEQLHELL